MQVKSKSGRVFDLPSDEENERIQAGIKADPDTYDVTDFSGLKKIGRPVSDNNIDRVNIRLDKEITTYFKASGKGWQTRMNDALLEYVHSH